MTWKQLKLLSHETVHRKRIKLVAKEKVLNSQKCLITLYIVDWVIIVDIDDLHFTSGHDQDLGPQKNKKNKSLT